MSDYLKKTVANKRTGANIIGIDLNYLNLMNYNPDFSIAFKQIQDFAEKTDEINLRNEQIKFKNELRQKQLDFKKKYVGKDVYSNQEVYDSYMAELESINKEAESKIMSFEYLDNTQKELFLQDYRNSANEEYIGELERRNQAVVKNTIDDTQLIIDTLVSQASQEDFYKTDRVSGKIEEISNQYDNLIKLGAFSETDKSFNLAKNIVQIESNLVERQLNENIIYGTQYPTIEDKKKAIEDIKKSLSSDERINTLIDSNIKKYKLEDNNNTREYMKAKLKESYGKINMKLNEQISAMETTKKMVDYENSKRIEEAYYKKDAYNFLYYTTGIKTSTTDLLNNANGYLDILAGRTEDKTNIGIFGDIYNDKVFPFLSSGIIQGINAEIRSRRQGDTPYTTREIFQPIYDVATELSKDENGSMAYLKRNAIIKDYGLRNGINPTILFLGENNPEVFRINDTLGIGAKETKRYKEETGEELNIKNLGMGWTASKNFKKLSESISDNKILGDYYATQYVLGNMIQQGITIEELLKSPKASLARILGDDQTDLFLKDAKTINQITTQRRDFKYINFKDPRIKEETSLQSQNTEITAQAGAFGGD